MGEALSSKFIIESIIYQLLVLPSTELASAEQLEERERQVKLREKRVQQLEKKWPSQLQGKSYMYNIFCDLFIIT